MANYVPVNVYNNPIVGMVDDGDAVNAAESNPRIEDVADNAEYCYQRVNAQHVSGGNHFEVNCTGDVNDVKLKVEANAGDAATVKIQTWENAAGTTTGAMLAGGTLLQTRNLIFGPGDFEPADAAAVAQFSREAAVGSYFLFSANDSTDYYAVTSRLYLAPGEQVQKITIAGNRPTNEGQTMTVSLVRRQIDQASLTIVGSVSLGAGTGEITTDSGAVTYTIADGYWYGIRATLNNNTPGTIPDDCIRLRGVQLDIAIP